MKPTYTLEQIERELKREAARVAITAATLILREARVRIAARLAQAQLQLDGIDARVAALEEGRDVG